MLGLEYISNGPPEPTTSVLLPALEKLHFGFLPNLKGWWRTDINNGEDGVSMNDHVSLSFPRLYRSVIIRCPKFSFLPLSPNIKDLSVENNTWKPFHQAALTTSTFSNLSGLSLSSIEDLQSLPEWFKCLTCLRQLGIMSCNNLMSLSPGIQQLASSLESLIICGCEQVDMFNNVGDPNFWEALTSLRELRLLFLPQLRTHLPQGVQHLTSLQELTIEDCRNLISIDSEWITNLKSLNALTICDCPNLTSLPQGIRHLTSLQTLEIVDCPILFKTCQADIGEHWPKVAHVPNFILKLTTTSTTSTFLGCNWNVFNKIRIPQFSNKRT